MSPVFSSSFPVWLNQPSILENVMHNPFIPLTDISSAVNITDYPLFLAGLKQALFWRRKLSASVSSNTVIFSFLGVRGLTLPNILEVCKALKNVCDMSSLLEVYRAPNSPFIGISFSKSNQTSIFQALHSFKDYFVFHVSATSSLSHHFKLQGLPPLFPDSRIHHFLAKHSIHHQFTRDLIATDDHISTPSNSVTGTLLLSSHHDLNKIPHLIPLPAPHLGSALLIISGRQALCLKCGCLGHIRRSCTTLKCSSCYRFHPPSSVCPPHDPLSNSIYNDSWMPNVITPVSSIISSAVISSLPKNDRTRHASSPAELTSYSFLPDIAASPTPDLNPTTSLDISTSPALPSLLSSSLVHTLDSNSITKKQRKRNSHAAKRLRSDSTSSLSSSPTNNTVFSNPYTLLIDEASLLTNSTTSPKDIHPSLNTLDHSAEAICMSHIDNQNSPVSPPADSDCVDTISSNIKKDQSYAPISTVNMLSSSLPFVTSPTAPASTWGDRMDVEANIILPASAPITATLHPLNHKTTNAFNPPSSDQSPHVTTPSATTSSTTIAVDNPHSISTSSISTSSTHINITPVLPGSNLPLLTSITPVSTEADNDTASEASSDTNNDYDSILFLSGFPVTATFGDIHDFTGQPYPDDIGQRNDKEGAFLGHFLKFSSVDHAYQILQKDGTWHHSRIMSLSIFEPDSESE